MTWTWGPRSYELRPVVDAVNALLARLRRTLEYQRAFVADAAHELRTPLTALKLQLQLAERSSGDAQHLAFSKVHERLDRANHLIGQLLTLARLEPEGRPRRFTPWIWDNWWGPWRRTSLPWPTSVGWTWMLRSRPFQRCAVMPDALRILLNNLVDNALRYTARGGRIRVSCATESAGAVLRVADTGPGIPADERDRVFDRFYRRLGVEKAGSGLGLAIVKQIADDHGAAVSLSDLWAGTGLVVTVRFSPG